jgi:2'-5' RNA ligase
VFIAIDPPEEVKGALANTINELEQAIPDVVRWVRPTGIHLTLKFLGDVNTEVVDGGIPAAMGQALEDFQDEKFQLSLSDLGIFGDQRRPRVIWAGVQGDLDSLEKLQRSVDDAVFKLGFSREKAPFRPHLTLGRVRDNVSPSARRPMAEAIFNREPLPSIAWDVDAIHLIHSNLRPEGATYTTLGSSYLS